MTEQLKQITKDELVKLPKEIQEAVNSLDWANLTEEIGKKYQLDNIKINKLQTEVLLVLVEVELLDNLKSNIINSSEIEVDDAEKISSELATKIFTPIANTLEILTKKKVKTWNPKWEQSVSFIVSGGDYSVFLDK